MARYICTRCKGEAFTTAGPHLCPDLAKRHARQAKAVEMVKGILVMYHPATDYAREAAALEIVRALSGRDLGVD